VSPPCPGAVVSAGHLGNTGAGLPMTITALTDARLIEQARGGDEAAFTELYVRHQPAALRLARTYRRLGDPDELVNGAFERVLGAIKRGAGPTDSFRAYLFVTLRRFAAEKASKPGEESFDDVPEPIADAADSPALAQADRALITEAFESLPERWQAVLWHTAVEGQQPKELAGVLGVSANAAAAMAYRAREKLRQAYLQAHLMASPAPDHQPYRSQLGAYVRGGLSARDTAAVDQHLEGCESCRALLAELEDVNRTLARAVLPLFLLVGGGTLGGALVGGAALGGAAATSGQGTGLLGKVRQLGPTVGSTAAIVAVIAGTVAMGSVVARQDTGPLNSAADAADLGTSDDDGSSSQGDGDVDSLFGDDDFALSPLDEESGDEFGDFDFGDFGDFDFPISRSSGPGAGVSRPPASSAASPPPATSPPPGPTTPPAPGPGPTNPDPVNPPPEPTPEPGPATPPPLAFSTPTFTPTELGRGTLSVTIAERGAPAGFTATAFQAPAGLGAPTAPTAPVQEASAPLRLELTLTSGARAFPEAVQDPRCAPPPTPGPGEGQVVSCTLDQPATGTSTTFAFDLQVDGPGQTADMVLFRGATEEARFAAPLPLETYASGLSVQYRAEPWTVDGPGTGTLSVTVAQAAAWEVTGATLTIEVTGGVRLDPTRPTSGCTEDAGGNAGITCVLPTIPAAGAVDFDVHLAVTGEGQKARSLALALGGTEVARLDQQVDLRREDDNGSGGSESPA
jgi:RNA polymerase sigma factor (sigma-70 family)